MTQHIKHRALEKLAFSGFAGIPGSPMFTTPPLTVGQTLYAASNPALLPPEDRRQVSNGIVGTGLDVNSPAKSLLKAGIGALAGNFVAKMLNMGDFGRGMLTATGANYGYRF